MSLTEPTVDEFAASKEKLAEYDLRHPERVSKYPYVWEFIYSTGSVRYVRSKYENKPPSQTAGRIGNEQKLGAIVRSHIVPNEKLNKLKAQPKEEQNGHSVDLAPVPMDTREYGDWHPFLDEDKKEEMIQSVLDSARIDPETTINDIPGEDLVKALEREYDAAMSPDGLADEELVSHIIDLQGALKQARTVLDKADKAMERFFEFVASADGSDEDQAEELALIARLHKKKFNGFAAAIHKADTSFDSIIENLEGA